MLNSNRKVTINRLWHLNTTRLNNRFISNPGFADGLLPVAADQDPTGVEREAYPFDHLMPCCHFFPTKAKNIKKILKKRAMKLATSSLFLVLSPTLSAF